MEAFTGLRKSPWWKYLDKSRILCRLPKSSKSHVRSMKKVVDMSSAGSYKDFLCLSEEWKSAGRLCEAASPLARAAPRRAIQGLPAVNATT